MKNYLEIIESVEIDKIASIEPVKIEVKDKSEAINLFTNEEKKFKGKKYIVRYHICKHDGNGNNRPCEIDILKNAA